MTALDSLYEGKLESCISDEDDNDMQDFDDIDSFSQELVVCNDEHLNISIPFLVDDVDKLGNFMVCSNKENMLKHVLMPCQLIQNDGCEELVQADIIETSIISNDRLPTSLQITLHARDQIVPKFSNHENICESTSVVGEDETQRSKRSHDDLVEAYEGHNIEYLCCEDYNFESCSSSNYNSKDECDLEIGSSFNKVSNVLFDEDIDMDQPVLCLNIFERGFHLISNLLYEEIIENSEILNVDQYVIVDLMLFDEDQFSSNTSYDSNVEGISDICEHGLYDKEGAIQADQ